MLGDLEELLHQLGLLQDAELVQRFPVRAQAGKFVDVGYGRLVPAGRAAEHGGGDPAARHGVVSSRFPPGSGGGGGLTISLEGGLEEVEESFFSRAFSVCRNLASQSIVLCLQGGQLASNRAIFSRSGATAASINAATSCSVNSRVMLLFLKHLALWRNTPFGGFAVNGYVDLPGRDVDPQVQQFFVDQRLRDAVLMVQIEHVTAESRPQVSLNVRGNGAVWLVPSGKR